jgi:hypothetical protein
MKDVYKLSQNKSLIYLLLFIINPLLHYYAFEARMYSMMAFLATLLFYALMKKKYRLYAYTALAAGFTHYFLIGVIAFQALFVYINSHKSERNLFFLPLMKALALFVPWVVVLILARPPVSQSFWIPTSTWKDFFLLPAIILTGYEQDAWIIVPFLSYISLLVSGVVIFGYLHHVTRQKKLHFLLLLGWALGIPLVVFVLSFFKPVFLPRYLIFASVGLTLLLIVCFESIKNRYIRGIAIGVFAVFLLSYASIQTIMRTKAPLKKIFKAIRYEMRENDVVYVTHEYDFHPAEYYLPAKQVYLYKKTYEELPWFVGKVLIDKRAFKDTLPRYPSRAFILNNDGTYTIQSAQ